MAQVTQRERKITLAINVDRAEDLPQTAEYVSAFIREIDHFGEYDVDMHVGVNAAQEDERLPIGFVDARGSTVENDAYEEEPDGLGY